MAQRRERPRLPFEALLQLRIVGNVCRQDLDATSRPKRVSVAFTLRPSHLRRAWLRFRMGRVPGGSDTGGSYAICLQLDENAFRVMRASQRLGKRSDANPKSNATTAVAAALSSTPLQMTNVSLETRHARQGKGTPASS